MMKDNNTNAFRAINKAYNRVFQPGKLSIGLVAPLENYAVGSLPSVTDHLERIVLAEQLGFSAIWLRDVPFNVPSFGDVGQIFDPFVYLGLLAGQTQHIALGTASIILPLRHPAHVAKAAASADALSDGRLLLGVASGDRPEEYPALNIEFEQRGARFRDSFAYIENMSKEKPAFENPFGRTGGGMDLLPKPSGSKLPLLITGGSQQNPDWLAQHGDGWITYPRDVSTQKRVVDGWRSRAQARGQGEKPIMQSLYIDLVANPDQPPLPIHLGFQSGITYLRQYLESLQAIGINHVALNLRFNRADITDTLQKLSEEVLPEFSNG